MAAAKEFGRKFGAYDQLDTDPGADLALLDGVPFRLNRGDGSGGRRLQVLEYPMREDHDVDDLGPATREFTLDAYLVGQDVLGQLDRLIARLELSGDRVLQHPTRGRLYVHIRSYRESFSAQALGRIDISIECVAAGSAPAAMVRPVYGVATDQAADQIQIAAVAAFERPDGGESLAFSVTGPAAVAKATSEVGAVLSLLDLATAGVAAVRESAARAAAMRGQLAALVLSPSALGLSLLASVRAMQSLDLNPFDNLRAQFRLLRSLLHKRDRADGNARALNTLTALAAMSEAVRLCGGESTHASGERQPGVAFTSADEALTARDELLAACDTLELEVDSATYAAIGRLRAALVMAMDAQAARLPQVATVVPERVLPVLVHAQRCYGDGKRVADILARNRIRHPLFVPVGQPLEILRDA